MIGATLLLVVAVVLVTAVQLGACKHVDDDGRPTIMWETDPKGGRIRGRCDSCFRRTRGWDVALRQAPAPPTARKATAAEVQQSRWRAHARRRTANRMRAHA